MPFFAFTKLIEEKLEEAISNSKGEEKEKLSKTKDHKYIDLPTLQILVKNCKKKVFLHQLLNNSHIIIPKKVVPVNKEYEILLAKRKFEQEQREYKKMVSNVSKEQVDRTPFKSFRGQMATGLDLVVTMFTFFVLFYFITSYMNESYRLVAGIFGATFGLIMETVLFMIRANAYEQAELKQKPEKVEFEIGPETKKKLEEFKKLK